jgi:hypothetical protein
MPFGPQERFQSDFEKRGAIELPEFSNTRVMMMPVVLGDIESIPPSLQKWRRAMKTLFDMQSHKGEVGYITIDEKLVTHGQTHRRAGLHVDGIYHGGKGLWSVPPSGPWASIETGALTVSSHEGCKAWKQQFVGWPGDEGECDHLAPQCNEAASEIFKPFNVYWFGGLCVHESLQQENPVARQFVRLSMPSDAPWFEGYTENSLGVKPTGPILPRRGFMNDGYAPK